MIQRKKQETVERMLEALKETRRGNKKMGKKRNNWK